MKTIVNLLFLLVLASESYSQTLVIELKNGTTKNFDTSSISKMYFSKGEHNLNQTIYTSVPVITHNYISELPAPQLLSPRDQSRFSHYPRKLTLRWKPVANAKSYTVEVDCLHCCAPRKWCGDVGRTYKRITSLTSTQYIFQFVGIQPGRWRVQAVDKNGKAGKQSQWYNFVFTR